MILITLKNRFKEIIHLILKNDFYNNNIHFYFYKIKYEYDKTKKVSVKNIEDFKNYQLKLKTSRNVSGGAGPGSATTSSTTSYST